MDKQGSTMTITNVISELDMRMLSKGIAGWRGANADIDAAIESENWGAIQDAQRDRSLHANTIALIFHKYADITPERGLHS